MAKHDVLKSMEVDLQKGLNSNNVKKYRDKYGWNELTPAKEDTLLEKIIDSIKEPMMIILLVAALISLIVGEWADSIGIVCAVALGITIGIVVEGQSKKAADELKKVCENIEVKVIRDGHIKQISSRELVPGDIVLINAGDKIPADARLIKATNLHVDESMLTGESEPSAKDAELVITEQNVNPADMKNMVFSGTLVTEGSATMLVTLIGDSTEIGIINQNMKEDNVLTPLQQKLGDFGSRISKISSIIAILLFFFMSYKSWPTMDIKTTSFMDFLKSIDPIKNAFVVCVALIVAAVPEGLPTMVNMTLALTMKKMAKINALVRKKEACETIGSVSVICSDKTGTLTENKMKVIDVFTDNRFINQENLNKNFVDNCALNSTANLEEKDGEFKFIGNSTECALLTYLMENKIDYRESRSINVRLKQFEFTSLKKKMFTVVQYDNGDRTFYAKGAPERILDTCKFIEIDNDILELNDKLRENIEREIKKLQTQAKRTLGFAYKKLDASVDIDTNIDDTEKDFIFTGFVGIMDPLRDDVKDAISKAKSAGIETKMLTGDNIVTAVAIAGQLGLLENNKKAVTSEDIDAMDDITLKNEIVNIGVVARSTPTTKMRIVQALKENNEVVAVTGDGINDAPALVKSDVGISMGITGTEVSQQASDIILKDDSFSTIISGVKWGRSIYENFQRFMQFQITVNLVAFITAILSIVAGFKLPFTTIQLLWVNIIMDGPPALSLGLEPVRDKMIERKPVNRKASIITKNMLISMVLNSLVMIAGIMINSKFEILGGTKAQQETILFSIFAFFSLWNSFNCREFGTNSILPHIKDNKIFLEIIAITAVIQILVVQVFAKFFNSVPLEFIMWIKIIIYTFSIVAINETIKLFVRCVRKN